MDGKALKRKRPASRHSGPAEPIEPGALWPIALLNSRLHWGSRSLAVAIKQGLRVHRWGKRGYVATDDLITFLVGHQDALQQEAAAQAGGQPR